MKLKNYLDKNNISIKSFSDSLGLIDKTGSMVRRICLYDQRPSPDLAKAVEEKTHGAVTRMELLYPEEYKKAV